MLSAVGVLAGFGAIVGVVFGGILGVKYKNIKGGIVGGALGGGAMWNIRLSGDEV